MRNQMNLCSTKLLSHPNEYLTLDQMNCVAERTRTHIYEHTVGAYAMASERVTDEEEKKNYSIFFVNS